MPSKAARPCSHPRCLELVTEGSRCPAHAKQAWAERNARPEIREDKRFYDSALWKKVRASKLRQDPWCEQCKSEGRATPAEMVDHRVRLRDGGARVAPDNLTSMCHACHNAKRSRESREAIR